MTRDTFLQIGFAGLAVVLCTVPTAADTKTHYEYDAAGQVTRQWVEDTETSAVLSEVRNEYDNLDRVWQTRQLATPNGNPSDNVDRVTEIGFDQAGNTVSVRRKATTGDALTMYDFDWANRCTLRREAQRWVEGEPQYADTTYGYDGRGHVVYVQDPVGNEARFTYDAGGRQSEEKRYEGTALDLRIVSAYDSRDNKIRETAYDSADVALTQKRWEYDSLDRNTRRAQLAYPASTEEIDLATDRVTDLTYDSGSQRLETETAYAGIPPAPRTTTYQYDEIGRLSLTTDPEGNTEQVTGYNVHSQVLTKTISEPPLADRTFTYGYDNLGHRTSETAHGPQEPETDYFYDALDRQTRVTDAKHYSTDTAYNAFGEVRLVTEDATGTTPRETESEYDQLGYLRVERTWAGEGRTQQEETNYAPDLMGRRTHIEFPDSSAWDYVYDAAGRMTHRTDPRTLVTVYERNWRGQVLKKWLGVELKETFDYNPLGWMTFAERDASNRVDFTTRDAFGQVTAETQTVNGTSKTLTHTYNQVGECVTLAYPAGVGVSLTYTHDGLGQVTEIKRNGALLASYTHAGSWLTERAIRTTALLPTWIRHQVTPDVHRRPSPIVNRADLNGQLSDIDRYVHTYDDVGNRLTATITGSSTIADTVGCDYDRLHRLTGAHYATGQTNEGFGYDLLSNRLTYADRDGGTTSYTPNLVNEYTVITPGANAPEHDSGNLTRNEHGYQLAYDYENRLVEVRDPSDTVLATYQYDALGRRVQISQGGVTTLLFHDGGAHGDADRIVAEYDGAGAGALKRYYVQGPTYADEHVLVHEWADAGSDADWYYLLSALDTVSGLANPAGRAAVWYTYDAYGRPWTTLADGCLEQPGQYRGDSDCSGDVNFDDIGYFVTALAGGENGEAAWAEYYRNRHNQEDPPCAYLCVNDVDGDGAVNFNDINPFVRCLVDGHQCAIGGPPGSRYAFTGRELDLDVRASGDPHAASLLTLYHYRARAYDAWHGRFLQRDPAEYAESKNPYLYCANNPAANADPSGEMTLVGTLGTMTKWAGLAVQVAGKASMAYGFINFVLSGADYVQATYGLMMADPQDFTTQLYYSNMQVNALEEMITSSYFVAGGAMARWAGGLMVSAGAAMSNQADLGNKLQYFFGQATGTQHNIERSQDMLRQLERIGLHDNPASRQYLASRLSAALQDPSNIVRVQEDGRVVREILLAGPRGFLKFETVWEGNKLITGFIFGG